MAISRTRSDFRAQVLMCDASERDEDCDGKINEEGLDCTCGDGYVSTDIGEWCDDGNADRTDLCTDTCKPAACGDGVAQPSAGETCDDGSTSDGDTCSPTCKEQKVLSVSATMRALASADLPGGGDYETSFSPGIAHVRRVLGYNFWLLYRFDDEHVFVMTARNQPPVPVDE